MPFRPSERYAYLTYGCALKIMASHRSKEELGIRCRRSGAQPGGNLGKIEVKRKFLVHWGKEEAPRIKVGTCSFITHLFSICERVRRSKELHKKMCFLLVHSSKLDCLVICYKNEAKG